MLCSAGDRSTFALRPGQTAVITTPNHPSEYNSGDCKEWIFGTFPGNTIKVTFTAFHVCYYAKKLCRIEFPL